MDRFVKDFKLTAEEISILFREDADRFESGNSFFTPDEVQPEEISAEFEPAPDLAGELTGALEKISLFDVGPSNRMEMCFGDRLTLITGDNALGKSFLLDCTWWATTGTWAGTPAFPLRRGRTSTPRIEFDLISGSGRRTHVESVFDPKTFSWHDVQERPRIPALAIFSRVDGSFAVSDPTRQGLFGPYPAIHRFSKEDLWNGVAGKIEGLVRDWVRWQQASDQMQFERLRRVLEHLSPTDLGLLSPGRTVRLPEDPRDIPTIRHRYGEVPILFASAGVQRVLSLAYLVLWSWREHELACERSGGDILKTMVVIVDELEAHLHPKWQRTALPALLDLSRPMGADIDIQVVAATHSPMIMASTETIFDSSTDVLYHLALGDTGIDLSPLPFVRYGDASSWLTSPIFGLRQARSREAERAIERAKYLQLSDEASAEDIHQVSTELKAALAADDGFWPRWLFFAERNGVRL